MAPVKSQLSNLRRPRILVRAARFGIPEYNRDRDLKRLMKAEITPSPHKALGGLIATEAQLEHSRKSGDFGYSIARHVEVLIAMMAEARLLQQSQPDG